jgi:hypothetical protein
MKFATTLFAALAFTAALASGSVVAADEKPAEKHLTPQQERMKSCNADAKAKDLKGDERTAFMKTCLGNKKLTPQQEKMTACNADAKAKGLKGKEFTDFRNNCLKNNSAAAPAK